MIYTYVQRAHVNVQIEAETPEKADVKFEAWKRRHRGRVVGRIGTMVLDAVPATVVDAYNRHVERREERLPYAG